MTKCDFCRGYINDRCTIGDFIKHAELCESARQAMSKLIKDGKVIKIDRLCTQIHGVGQLNKIEVYLNQIGYDNIMHISTIGEDMLVVYRSEVTE